MKTIAVPMSQGRFSTHFGGADQFALVSVDETGAQPAVVEVVPAPPHARGAFPQWMHQRGVDAVIAGGMGGRASSMFTAYGIDVVTGIEGGDPVTLATEYVAGRLVSSGSLCAGGGLHDCGHHDEGH